MPDTITLTSTTDDEAQVRSALGLPVADAPLAEPVADPAATGEPVAEAVPDADAVEEADAAAAPSPQHQAAGKKRGRLQSRIDELVDERDRVRGINAASQAELDALRKKVADLVALPAPPAAPVVAAEAIAKPTVEAFATYEEYTEAVADWAVTTKATALASKLIDERLKADRAEREQTARQQTQTERQRAYATAEQGVRAKYEDYGDVINTPDLKASDLMVTEMLEAGALGPEIAYYLGKHPAECKALYALGNSAGALKAFGKMEARVEAALAAAAAPTAAGDESGRQPVVSVAPSAGSVAKPAAKPAAISKAPDPITPVGAGAQGTTIDPSQMSYQDYREWRNTQERKRSGLR